MTAWTDALYARLPEATREFDQATGGTLYSWLELLGYQADAVQQTADQIALDGQGRSLLLDPVTAPSTWAAWARQLYSAGPYAGTVKGIIDGSKLILTGSQYIRVTKHADGDPWKIAVRTRTSETPAGFAAWLASPAVKPAGYTVTHTTYEAPWDTVTAEYPTWDDVEATSWDVIEETGAPDD